MNSDYDLPSLSGFSSPYNTTSRLCQFRDQYYALNINGTIHHVEEGHVPDKRTSTGYKLKRTDLDTGKSLMGVSLMVLPENFDKGKDAFILLNLVTLIRENDTLRSGLQSVQESLDALEREFDNDRNDRQRESTW